MDDLAFSPDDIETFAEPVTFHGQVQTLPIKPIPPLEDIFTGRTLGRILDLLGCFARAGLAPGGHAPVEDALWLGNSLGILREFMVLKSDHRWVESMIEALERIPGAAQGDIVSRLRAMRAERWPFARGTWVELLGLIDGVDKAETETGERKDPSLAGKKPKKKSGPNPRVVAALWKYHELDTSEPTLDPAGLRELGKMAGASHSVVDRFFKYLPGGHDAYGQVCRNGASRLRAYLEGLEGIYKATLPFDERKHKGVYDPDRDNDIDRT